MSIKDNVNFIKEEISTEEKFFEGFFKLEKLWKKYKVAVIGAVAVAIVALIGVNVTNYLTTQNKIKANIAFNSLVDNSNDAGAKAVLKELNPKLLAIAEHIKNNGSATDVEFLDLIVQYNIAVDKNDMEAVNKTMLNSKFLLKEYAIFQKALMQTLNQNYTDAKETIKLIPKNSSVSQLSNKLQHYLLTK